jgi:hypothetical protein
MALYNVSYGRVFAYADDDGYTSMSASAVYKLSNVLANPVVRVGLDTTNNTELSPVSRDLSQVFKPGGLFVQFTCKEPYSR